MDYRKIVEVNLPTNKGKFKMIAYQNGDPNKYHLALIRGDVKNKLGVLVRLHSSCITGDIFGSLRCDCGPQLESAMTAIEKADQGIILYLFQEGRGIGLINKLKAYKLQEQGLDTVEANLKLGLPVDLRSYKPAAQILQDLGVKSIGLMTNNPDKVTELINLGIKVDTKIPLEITPISHNKKYLATKKLKLGHTLTLV